MKHRWIALLAALWLLAGCVPGTAEGAADGFVMAGYDGKNTQRLWSQNAFFTTMQERTGVGFAFNQYITEEEWRAAKASMLKGGQTLPDVLFKACLTREEEEQLYSAGVLIDLKPLLSENCPNLSQLLADHPEILDQIALPGGQVVSLPFVTFASAQNCMWINAKWLNQLKLEEPTDLESLENVLRAFKTRDPNMNGRNDEIPLSFMGIFDLNFLSHAFGFIMNDYHIYAEDGKAVFAPLTDEYMNMIRWLRDMYQEGLLDQNGFYNNDSLRAVTDTKTPQTYGIFLNPTLTNLVPAEWVADYQLLMPLTFEGSQVYRALMGNVTTGTFAVTTACKDPERMLRWVDELYTEEGAALAAIGRENVDYVVDGDGTWRLTDRYRSNPTYPISAAIGSGSIAPGVSSDEFQLRYSDAAIVRVIRDTMQMNGVCRLPFPAVSLTEEQLAYISPLQNRIGLETDLQASRWVLGEDELTDESVAAFRARLHELGVEDFMGFWQELLDKLEDD